MTTRRTLLLACLIVALLPSVSNGAEQKVELAVVVAKDSPVSSLSYGLLRQVYMGERVKADGTMLIPFASPPLSSNRVAFDQLVLRMSPDSVTRYWIDRKLRGLPGSARVIPSPETLVKVVVKLEGAVGYVPLDAVTSEVKVLKIDDKRPGEPGYPLRQ